MTDTIDLATYGGLTRLIYGAVLDQDKWQAFLDELTKASGGVRTHMFGFDIPAGISLGLTASGYAPEYLRSYNDYYGEMNAWAPGFARGEPGVVIPSEHMCPKHELFGTEFYNDWVRPQEDVAAGGGAMIFKDETRMLAFGGNIRLKDEEKLERKWLALVGLLAPHLQQAFELARALAGRTLEANLLHSEHVRPPAAVLLLADNGFLLYANEVAERLLGEGSVLRVGYSGRVTFGEPGVAEALDRCLASLRRGGGAAATFSARAAAHPVSGEGAGRTVRTACFDAEAHGVAPFPLLIGLVGPALLVTIGPEGEVAPDLAAAHGLTKAETEIVRGIADGLTPAELADRRRVSIHTVRNQLKSAMAKTGASRQIDLVLLAARR